MNQTIDLEKVMQEEWEKVRSHEKAGFYYPSLKRPSLVEKLAGGGQWNHHNLKVTIGKNYIQELEEAGIDPVEAMNEVLSSVSNIFMLQKIARKYVDKRKAEKLRYAFGEAQTNVFMVNKAEHPATVPVAKVLIGQEKVPSPYGHLMWGLYQEVWGQDLGIELNNEEKDLVEKLKKIDFVDKDYEQFSFRRFVNILKDYNPPEEQAIKILFMAGLGMFSDNQIKNGIREFAQECDVPGEFEAIIAEVLGEESDDGIPISVAMPGCGSGKGQLLIAQNYYSARAEKYAIPVRKRPMKKNGSMFPHSRTPYTTGDTFHDIDAFSTPKIMPRLTKKWIKKRGEVMSECEKTPNSILVIDNSPSMPDPNSGLSIPVLGATAISNAYLDNDAKVAVYSFGGNDHFINFSDNKQEVHQALRYYSHGGGTTFNREFLENALKQSDEEFDITVVSDMDIHNLEDFIDTVLKIPKMHRIHLLCSGNRGYGSRKPELEEKFADVDHVAVLDFYTENDIYSMVLGELKNSVK
jgi:hypothetical protein